MWRVTFTRDECLRAAQEMRRSAQAIRDERPDLVAVIEGNERIAAIIEWLLATPHSCDGAVAAQLRATHASIEAGASLISNRDVRRGYEQVARLVLGTIRALESRGGA